MTRNPAVLYSFLLYVLYVLLPLIPAILIFRLFPDTKVSVTGPLQNLTLNATGAFAAYVVTAALGFFLVRNVAAQIQWTRTYAVQGVIVDLAENQSIGLDGSYQSYSRYTNTSTGPDGRFASKDFYFVILFDHPVERPEVDLKLWNLTSTGGIGDAPPGQPVTMKLLGTSSSPQRFKLQLQGSQPAVVPLS